MVEDYDWLGANFKKQARLSRWFKSKQSELALNVSHEEDFSEEKVSRRQRRDHQMFCELF